jgi:hypothetical protein
MSCLFSARPATRQTPDLWLWSIPKAHESMIATVRHGQRGAEKSHAVSRKRRLSRSSLARPNEGASISIDGHNGVAVVYLGNGSFGLLPAEAHLSKLVSCAPSSATKTASRLAGSVALAFSLMRC